MTVEDAKQKGLAIAQDTISSTRERIGSMSYRAQTYLDQTFPPEKRDELKERASSFSKEHPFVVSFLATYFLFALPLLVTFFCIATFIIITPLIIAISFITFWLSLVTLGLLGALTITAFTAATFWIWAVSSLLFGLFVYKTARKLAGKVKGTSTAGEKKLIVVSKPVDGATLIGINGDGSLGRVKHVHGIDGIDESEKTKPYVDGVDGESRPEEKTPVVGTEEVMM